MEKNNNNLAYQRSKSVDLDSKKSLFKRSISSPNIRDIREISEIKILRGYIKKKIELYKVGIGKMKSSLVKGEEPRDLAINEGYVVLNVPMEDWNLELNDKFITDHISKGLSFGVWNNLNKKEEAILKKKESIKDLNEFLLEMSKKTRCKAYPLLSAKERTSSITAREIKMLIESGYEKGEGSPTSEIFKLEFLTKEDHTFQVFLKKQGLERQLSITDKKGVHFVKFKSQRILIEERKPSTNLLPKETRKRSADKEKVIRVTRR